MAGLLSALLLSVGLGSIAPPPALPTVSATAASSLTASVETPTPSLGTGLSWSRTPTGPRSCFGARYYGSKIGRFTTVDPAYNWNENLLDPQRWNRYAYSRNNPLRYVDPDGRDPVTVAIIVITAAAFVLNNPTNTNVTQGPVNDTIIPNSVIVVAGAGFAAGGARMAAKEVLQETVENVTGLPVGGLPNRTTRGGETRFTAAGRRAHAQEPLPPGFERDVRLPSGKRMDGYNAAEKQVLELKPDNQRAVRRGERQVEGYCSECDQTYGPAHSGRGADLRSEEVLGKGKELNGRAVALGRHLLD